VGSIPTTGAIQQGVNMLTRLIGDVHGKYNRYKTILRESPIPTIQLGDMGVGFFSSNGTPAENPPYDLMVEKSAKFIRGNHDNPAVCKRHTQYIPDGTIDGEVMFVGGGLSIDKPYRTEGYSYWLNEELSIDEFDKINEIYMQVKPKVMLTHETTEDIALAVVHENTNRRENKLAFPSITRLAFQKMWQQHAPELWVFGHWHLPFDHVVNGTRFVCLPELATMDVDLPLAKPQ
jgi:predicted phosphodiesterase